MSFRKRWFLEPPSSGVDSYVVVDDDNDIHVHSYDSILLKIADCDRRVHLYFPTGTAERRRQARRKLERLRQALDLLEERIEL